jgi:hypothetical protein
MGKFNPQTMAINVISITTSNGILCITCIFKLNETVARRPRRKLQVNFNNRSILVKYIFDVPLSKIDGEISNI